MENTNVGNIPNWQKKLADAPGVPVEYWHLSEDELIKKLKGLSSWHNTMLSIPPLSECQLTMAETQNDN